MPAPTWDGSVGTVVGGGGALTTTLDVSSLGLADGDQLIMPVAWRGQFSVITPTETGWDTPILHQNQSTGPTMSVFTRTWNTGEPTSYTFTTTGTASRICCGAIKVGQAALDVAGAVNQGAAQTALVAPTITSGGADRLLIRIWAFTHTDTVTNFPGVLTSGYTQASGGAAAGHISVRAAYGTVGSGATGTQTINLSTGRNYASCSLLLVSTFVPPVGATMRRWDGSAFQDGATLRRWNGSTFVSGATLRRWNGSSFVPAP
jgi:hypothetical protein